MTVKVSKTRTSARAGVNATQTFFEQEGCVFQSVSQENDFGKDAYIDMVEGDAVTHLCVAVQVKSGSSYRTAEGGYFVPVDGHATNWRRSTVPVFGVVYDPDGSELRWVDLTGYLRRHPQQCGGVVPIARSAILNPSTLRGAFSATLSQYEAVSEGVATLTLLAPDEALQTAAVWDTWALGRHDARNLIILRRVLLDLKPRAVREALSALSHATPHPDIFFTPQNWIPPNVEKAVQRTFRWTPAEIARMFEVLEVEEWVRGGLGQCADMLLYQDPDVVPKLDDVVGVFVERADLALATRVATVALSHARDARAELAILLDRYPALGSDEWFAGVAAMARKDGTFALYS